jgi:hypothetical protein
MKSAGQPRYALLGIGVAALILVLFFVYFALTHAQWFDGMGPSEKVKFWSDFGVAFGTIALAIITVTSVFETQDVLKGEDRRFRQSRMPMVKVTATRRERGGVYLALRNDGDSPARNVRLTFDAHTRLTWNEQGTPFDHDQVDETNVTQINELCSSFAGGQPGSLRVDIRRCIKRPLRCQRSTDDYIRTPRLGI